MSTPWYREGESLHCRYEREYSQRHLEESRAGRETEHGQQTEQAMKGGREVESTRGRQTRRVWAKETQREEDETEHS